MMHGSCHHQCLGMRQVPISHLESSQSNLESKLMLMQQIRGQERRSSVDR